MSEPQQIPVPPPRAANKSNCLLIGCAVVALGFVLIIVGVTVAGYLGLRSFAEQYTEAEPRQLPITTISEEDYEALSERYEAFVDAAQEQESVTLTLTAGDLNALIRNHPDFREARGHVYVTIEEDIIGGQISYPIPEGFPMLGGRYINGSATFQLEIIGGRPALYFESIEVAGKTPPNEMLGQLRQENLLQNAYQDPQFAQVLNRVESVKVSGGLLEITTK